MTIRDNATGPVECVETRTATFTIGRPRADEVTVEISIAVWDHVRRTFVINHRVGSDIVELNSNRARNAADEHRRIAATLDAYADDVDRLAELESTTTALLDGRARAAAA